MKIKAKLLSINSAVIIVVLLLGGIIIYNQLAAMTEKNIKKNLAALNYVSFQIVENEVKSTIINYLRFKSHQYMDGVKWFYNSGLQKQALKQKIKKLLNTVVIGKTGYMYAINSEGKILYHPRDNFTGKNLFNHIKPITTTEMNALNMKKDKYLRYKIKNKGYFEYIDQSESGRAKAMYMVYFDKMDFILCSAAFKDEFSHLIDTKVVMKNIISDKPNMNSYFFVLDNNGYMISHPGLFKKSLINLKGWGGKYFIKEIITKKNGRITYRFKNRADKRPKIKIAQFKHLKLLDWFIVSASNREDVFEPIYRVRNILVIIGLVVIGILFVVIILTSSTLTNPINKLMQTIYKMQDGDLNERADISTKDEIGELGETFNNMAAMIQDYTQNLENKVKQRTEELKRSLEQVEALNEQMAGDYFLTSLILNPLMSKSFKSSLITIDFYLSQKKKFNFRKKQGEIGGDINIAHAITLRGKKFTVFANGDAMGKSLQGAGGALVFGVVFNSFVERTTLMRSLQIFTPERWLRESYNELQTIFESFDGSMLISAVIGLVDEVSGLLYYINSEHPWPVLYRNGKAKFTMQELDIRKIGTVTFGGEKSPNVRLIHLEKGDKVFIGSDGRDDIMIGIDEETGHRIINEDERKFLTNIELAHGNVEELINVIKDQGEITDDISILSIQMTDEPEWRKKYNSENYLNEKQAGMDALKKRDYESAIKHLELAVDIYPDDEALKDLYKCYKEINNIEKELEIVKKIIWYHPGVENLDYVYLAGVLNKKLKNYYAALDYGENYRRYKPEHVNNLINLCDAYRIIGALERCRELVERAEKIEPDNKNIKKLKKLITGEKQFN